MVLDHITNLPTTDRGFRAILTINDECSGMLTAIPVKKLDPAETAAWVISQMHSLCERPKLFRTDNGPGLSVDFHKHLERMLKELLPDHDCQVRPGSHYNASGQNAAEGPHHPLNQFLTSLLNFDLSQCRSIDVDGVPAWEAPDFYAPDGSRIVSDNVDLDPAFDDLSDDPDRDMNALEVQNSVSPSHALVGDLDRDTDRFETQDLVSPSQVFDLDHTPHIVEMFEVRGSKFKTAPPSKSKTPSKPPAKAVSKSSSSSGSLVKTPAKAVSKPPAVVSKSDPSVGKTVSKPPSASATAAPKPKGRPRKAVPPPVIPIVPLKDPLLDATTLVKPPARPKGLRVGEVLNWDYRVSAVQEFVNLKFKHSQGASAYEASTGRVRFPSGSPYVMETALGTIADETGEFIKRRRLAMVTREANRLARDSIGQQTAAADRACPSDNPQKGSLVLRRGATKRKHECFWVRNIYLVTNVYSNAAVCERLDGHVSYFGNPVYFNQLKVITLTPRAVVTYLQHAKLDKSEIEARLKFLEKLNEDDFGSPYLRYFNSPDPTPEMLSSTGESWLKLGNSGPNPFVTCWNMDGVSAVFGDPTRLSMLDQLFAARPVAVCLQETMIQIKAEVASTNLFQKRYPEYTFMFHSSSRSNGYAGTCIAFHRSYGSDSVTYLPVLLEDCIALKEPNHEGRVQRLDFANFTLINLYSVNSMYGLIRKELRSLWDEALGLYFLSLSHLRLLIVGDFNACFDRTSCIHGRHLSTADATPSSTLRETEGLQSLVKKANLTVYRPSSTRVPRHCYSFYPREGRCWENKMGLVYDYAMTNFKIVPRPGAPLSVEGRHTVPPVPGFAGNPCGFCYLPCHPYRGDHVPWSFGLTPELVAPVPCEQLTSSFQNKTPVPFKNCPSCHKPYVIVGVNDACPICGEDDYGCSCRCLCTKAARKQAEKAAREALGVHSVTSPFDTREASQELLCDISRFQRATAIPPVPRDL